MNKTTKFDATDAVESYVDMTLAPRATEASAARKLIKALSAMTATPAVTATITEARQVVRGGAATKSFWTALKVLQAEACK